MDGKTTESSVIEIMESARIGLELREASHRFVHPH